VSEEKIALTSLFKGRRAKWLSLFRRIVARINSVGTFEMTTYHNGIAIGFEGDQRPTVGLIQFKPDGLMIGLALTRTMQIRSPRLQLIRRKFKVITHETLVSEGAQIDDELLSWVRAAVRQARGAKTSAQR